MNAPICLFTYNRFPETQKTIESLKENFLASESDLIIFSDGPKNETAIEKVEEVRNYIHKISGFKSIQIFESKENKGLANSIISGVTLVVEKHNKVIVLEDDLITTPNFLNFMNQALVYYENELSIQTICGYSLYIKNINRVSDFYFQKRPFSWGWATWSNRWNKDLFDKKEIMSEINQNQDTLIKFKNKFGNDISDMLLDSLNNVNDSWYVRWTYDHFKNNRYAVYPSLSLVENIGHGDDSSTHCKGINSYTYVLDKGLRTSFDFDEFKKPEKKISKQFLKYFTLKHKVIYRIKLLLKAQGRKELFAEIKMRFKKFIHLK